ncbi:actin-interacting protein 1-like, partial [Diaphorina citri]|uniref:Actin-interacting protein 1-like n=1 Tax=Diaphorina citri TaxID=121845 RepID=A0A3Q0JL00_DIACI
MSYSNKYIFATLPRTQRGQPIVLGGDPKGKNFLYTNGNSVIIRNIENPAISDIYTEHSCAVNVAKYSPSGFYIASGDISGKVRIWDTVNKEHILKNEFHPIGGPIKDIAWSPDNQRMVVVGEGRERFGHVFMSETGTSVGEISGQSKPINSCDFKPSRPFRIITGSEDNTIAVFEGPPFKFKMTKFVQAVRYSPSGSHFASAGFDGKVFLYDGASADLVSELGNPAHKGGVYAVAWKPDGTQLLTASGDKTCKLWDIETKSAVSEFLMGNQVEDQQVSCLWQGDYLLTVSLSGFISYLDVNNPSTPIRVIK